MNDEVAAAEIAGLVARLITLPSEVSVAADRIDVIAALEKLKAAVAAAQLQVVADFATEEEASKRAMGFEARYARRGIPEQVGLATKTSPSSAARQVSRAKALSEQLPETFTLFRRGEVSEWAVNHVVKETSHLGGEDRRLVDKRAAGQLPKLSPRQAGALARKLAIEVDPAGAVKRASNARQDRRVGVRPAPDTMAVLSALVPCEQGVAAYASLRRHAEAAVAAGDGRSLNQLMADTLVQRLTGQATADSVSAEIGLVMTDSTLFGRSDEPADLTGYGPIPAQTARNIADQNTNSQPGHAGAHSDNGHHGDGRACNSDPAEAERARIWVRRLSTDPVTGVVVDCDPRRRRFDGVLARLLTYRDGGRCRTPYCDAPIRHIDHIRSYAAGGPTTSVNGRGTCQRCNIIREMPGWKVQVIDEARHIVETTTPTGHRYRSSPLPAPGTGRSARARQLVSFRLRWHIDPRIRR
jgi:hypothetical protein